MPTASVVCIPGAIDAYKANLTIDGVVFNANYAPFSGGKRRLDRNREAFPVSNRIYLLMTAPSAVKRSDLVRKREKERAMDELNPL